MRRSASLEFDSSPTHKLKMKSYALFALAACMCTTAQAVDMARALRGASLKVDDCDPSCDSIHGLEFPGTDDWCRTNCCQAGYTCEKIANEYPDNCGCGGSPSNPTPSPSAPAPKPSSPTQSPVPAPTTPGGAGKPAKVAYGGALDPCSEGRYEISCACDRARRTTNGHNLWYSTENQSIDDDKLQAWSAYKKVCDLYNKGDKAAAKRLYTFGGAIGSGSNPTKAFKCYKVTGNFGTVTLLSIDANGPLHVGASGYKKIFGPKVNGIEDATYEETACPE